MADIEARAESMVRLYGEACSKRQAARIIHCCADRITAMLKDGRLDAACQGTRVDVRSIARYIAAPRQEDFEAKKRRVKMKYDSGFAV